MRVGEYKSPSGLIRAEVETEGDTIKKISFTGDFFIYPEDSLKELEGRLSNIRGRGVLQKIEEFYETGDVNSPKIGPEDWFKAVARALEEEDE